MTCFLTFAKNHAERVCDQKPHGPGRKSCSLWHCGCDSDKLDFAALAAQFGVCLCRDKNQDEEGDRI